MSRLIILSPHLDDAVFSCWHMVNRPNTTVLTVFAGVPKKGTSTLWDRLCGQADSRIMTLKRREENTEIISQTLASVKYLDFLDNQYRSTKLSPEEITKKIIKSTPRDSSYLVPLAASHFFRHPDHLLLRQVGVILNGLGRKVSFYPDLPYMGVPKKVSTLYLQRLSKRSSKLLSLTLLATFNKLSPDELLDKNKAMRSYESQYKMTNISSLGRLGFLAKRDYEVILQADKLK